MSFHLLPNTFCVCRGSQQDSTAQAHACSCGSAHVWYGWFQRTTWNHNYSLLLPLLLSLLLLGVTCRPCLLTSTMMAISQGEKGSSLGLMMFGDRKHLHLHA
jgi:hypothetical protein